MSTHSCRACGSTTAFIFIDLGLTPISNAFVRPEDADRAEKFYPLSVMVCSNCWLAQLSGCSNADTHFHDDYVYFSSFSSSWLTHSYNYVQMAIKRFGLTTSSKVMEIASNDGYLLQYFVEANIPCLGIEPSANTAKAARDKGVESRELFFDSHSALLLSDDGWKVDLVVGNNVLAHTPYINDFVAGLPTVLNQEGVITLEFPHLLRLIEENQFDTIYHEHYFYLSLSALIPIFDRVNLRVFDVEHITTHGGSLRIFVCHANSHYAESATVSSCLDLEYKSGLTDKSAYIAFAERVKETKRTLLTHLIELKRNRKTIVAYGAAAKGNTLLNYCGIGPDFIDYVVDKNPSKQGRLLPGTRIPVHPPEHIFATKPDEILILPWNIRDEIIQEMSGIREWGGRFSVAIPKVEML